MKYQIDLDIALKNVRIELAKLPQNLITMQAEARVIDALYNTVLDDLEDELNGKDKV